MWKNIKPKACFVTLDFTVKNTMPQTGARNGLNNKENYLSNPPTVEPTPEQIERDQTIWRDGYNARLKFGLKKISAGFCPYNPFEQRDDYTSWITGFKAGCLALDDDVLPPIPAPLFKRKANAQDVEFIESSI